MIASGEKKEEYREIKPYYMTRFKKLGTPFHIRFRAGYSRYSPLMQCLVSVSTGTGKPEWGAVGCIKYFILTIHEKEVFPEVYKGPEEWD